MAAISAALIGGEICGALVPVTSQRIACAARPVARLSSGSSRRAFGIRNLQQHASPVGNSVNRSSIRRSPLPADSIRTHAGDGGNDGNSGGGGSGGGGGGGDEGKGDKKSGGIFSALLTGWNDRVNADPEFAFKVGAEMIIGVTACVLGDMAARPNFGMNELDFVFSTLVVGSILNFTLMYLLAPTATAGAASAALPGIFKFSPTGHMFEPGAYSLIQRAGTFAYKGVQFGAAGFAAGLLGTAISNGLLAVRKQLQPGFIMQNDPPPTILNAATWALHLGLNSNFRYQSLNGIEMALGAALPPGVFKGLVFGLRAMNNVMGGMSFVALAKITGSQKADKLDEAKLAKAS